MRLDLIGDKSDLTEHRYKPVMCCLSGSLTL